MNIAQKAEQLFVVRVIRRGLVSMVPVLLIGAFALVLKSFPVAEYQSFISSFAGGFLLYIFDLVYKATFGVLSVYMKRKTGSSSPAGRYQHANRRT